LSLKTTLGDCEVNCGDQRLGIGWDVHELISRAQEHLEGRVVVHCFISDLNNLSRALLNQILSQNWEEHRFDAINFKNYENFSESDG
jgi:NADH/NAD ratio-sensing transcriptional regulator Rex